MTRETMPYRRFAETFDFEHFGPSFNCMSYTATVGRYADGRVGEIFLNSAKLTTDSDINARDAAVLASFALQSGVGVKRIRDAMCRDAEGRPLGVMGTLFDMIGE